MQLKKIKEYKMMLLTLMIMSVFNLFFFLQEGLFRMNSDYICVSAQDWSRASRRSEVSSTLLFQYIGTIKSSNYHNKKKAKKKNKINKPQIK